MNRIITKSDPPPFHIIEGKKDVPLLLICDHAGNRVPERLHNLGLPSEELGRHIAFDRGAKEVTDLIAKATGATAILSTYSRLVIDCNRPPDHNSLIPTESDKTIIQSNIMLGLDERARIMAEIYSLYHKAVNEKLAEIDRSSGKRTMLIAIHSFTPKRRADNTPRPWHVGIAYKDDVYTAKKLIEHFRRSANNLTVGDNEPFSLKNSYTILRNSKNGRLHAFIEIRKDQIETPTGQQFFARILSDFLSNNMPKS